MNAQQFLENQIAQTRLELQIKERLLNELLASNTDPIDAPNLVEKDHKSNSAELAKGGADLEKSVSRKARVREIVDSFGDKPFTLNAVCAIYSNRKLSQQIRNSVSCYLCGLRDAGVIEVVEKGFGWHPSVYRRVEA